MATTYGGVYRARCMSIGDRGITVQVPQVFGTSQITFDRYTGAVPSAGDFGWVIFESGQPELPVWVSGPASAPGGPLPESGLTAEQIQDMMAGFLVAGANVTLTYDDVGGSITIDVASLSDEQIEDIVGGLIVGDSYVSVDYDDPSNTITIGVLNVAKLDQSNTYTGDLPQVIDSDNPLGGYWQISSPSSEAFYSDAMIVMGGAGFSDAVYMGRADPGVFGVYSSIFFSTSFGWVRGADPVIDDDYSTKRYVDAAIAGVSGGEAGLFANFKTNDIDVDGSVTYVCMCKPDGDVWLVQRLEDSGDDTTVTYANVSNNGSVTTYTDAFANRATLTYDPVGSLVV